VKYITVYLFVLISLSASEIDRMESIVKDIEKLRQEHHLCLEKLESQNNNSEVDTLQKKLKEQNLLYFQEKEKNAILQEKIEALQNRFSTLEKQIKDTKPQVTKESKQTLDAVEQKELQSLKNNYEKTLKQYKKTIKTLKAQIDQTKKPQASKEICKDDNPFPALLMKKAKKETKLQNTKTNSEVDAKKQIQEPQIIQTVPSTYRLNKESKIYDKANGKEVTIWEKSSSFTSKAMTKEWIKISGYFVDKQWVEAKVDLWVEKTNTIKR
jgi:predicted RNase H-like nuclease (RuvC/YqgF family)